MYLSILNVLELLESGSGNPPWWNYPGLELWKFVNLALFIAAALILHRRFGHPIREGLRSRREAIKRELERAKAELDQAHKKLADVEARFQSLDKEIGAIKERAQAEAAAERERLRSATEHEINRMREQAKREIESAGKVARHELRKYAAQESVRLAEEILAKEIRPEDDARLTALSIGELGRRRK